MRRFAWILVAIVAAALLVAGWYAYDKGFTKKWRATITGELRKRGFEVSLRRMTLEPWRGIVAKEVKLYDARDRKRILGVVDEVRLVINFADFFHGKPFLEALDLRDAHLALPLDPKSPRGPRIEISKLSGRLLLPPRQLYLTHLEADLYGVHLTASGRLIRPEALTTADHSEPGPAPLAIIEQIITELKATHFEADPPQLDIRFSGDLGEPDKLFVEATLWGEKIRRHEYRLENIYMALTVRDGIIAVRQLIASDALGVLRASGSFHPATRDASLRVESNLDAQALANAFGVAPSLSEFVFYTPPAIDMSAKARLGHEPAVLLLGHLELRKFAYKSVVFEKLAGDFSWDGIRWSARDLQLVHRSGEITGDVLQSPPQLRSRLHNTINPKVLAPILSGKVKEWFSRFEFVPAVPGETGAQRPARGEASAGS